MNLGKLISILEAEDPRKVLKYGFGAADSYRGYYEQIAFEPAANVTVGSMLAHAKDANGSSYYGYKGGKYVMDLNTIVNIAEYGSCSVMDDDDVITEMWLRQALETAEVP